MDLQNEDDVLKLSAQYEPHINEFGFSENEYYEKLFEGGEEAGLARLDKFVNESLKTYVDTRNDLDGDLFSSKMSPWLANGSVSCR